MRKDIEGLWDVEVHACTDRSKFGYAIVIVKDRHGTEVARYTCKVMGVGRDRTVKNNDTPAGIYKIGDWAGVWVPMNDKCAFGYNEVLRFAVYGW